MIKYKKRRVLVMGKINDRENALEKRFGIEDINNALEKADEEANNPSTKYYSHKEMKQMARRIINGK